MDLKCKKKKYIVLWRDFCQGSLPMVGASTLNVTNIWYRYNVIMPVVWVGVGNDILWMYEVLKNIWIRTYIAGVSITNGVSKNLGARVDTAIRIVTIFISDDCEVSKPEGWTNGIAVWKMYQEVSLEINT
jgi:hypothetical protein